MKKLTKIKGWLSVLVCGLLAFSCSFVACNKSNGKNLIYLIGDGMGFAHIENTKLYMGEEKLSFEDYYVGEVTTRSASHAVTDSAAAGTALATGAKTTNGFVGMSPDGKKLENLMEISKKVGKKTGIVTTDTLDGATPAAFSAHVTARTDVFTILDQQCEGDVDLLMGKHLGNYRSYQEDFAEKDFGYADSLEGLQTLSSQRVLANVNFLMPKYGLDDTSGIVTLKDLVKYALDFLSKDNDKGFTLMVEGAYIDKHSHNNDIFSMIYALMDFNDAIEYVLEWASARTDTSVIITADHETGGLQKAASKESLSDDLYEITNHSAANVPLYMYNAKTELTAIDNTDVFRIAKGIVKD